MGNPSIQEQLKIVSALISHNENLQDSLGLHEKILQIQLEIDNTPTKGTIINWEDQTTIATLQRKFFDANKPIIHFLDPSIFNFDLLFRVTEKIVEALIGQNINERGLKKFLDFVESGEINLFELIKATLGENIVFVRKAAERWIFNLHFSFT